jgi:hypothetical protein
LASKFDELLGACAHPDLYRRNGFRTLGLAVPVDPRGISRGFDELSISLQLGAEPGAWAFAPQPAPTSEGLRAAARALQDPMRRLLDEFFWFWPLTYPEAGADAGLAQLARGDTAAATLDWSQAAGQGHPVAWHNLAVYQHLLALEWERSADCDPAVLNQVWREAADYWQRVQADDTFWSLVQGRVSALDDPQLPPATVHRLRERLPEILARIHAENAVHYVTKNAMETARLHVRLAQSHLSAERIAAVFEATAQPAVGRLENHVAQARRQAAAHPADALAQLRPLVRAAAPDLALLAAFGGSPSTAHLHGDHTRLVADTVLDGLVAYQRATGDDLACLPVVLHLLDVATAPELAQRTEQAFGAMLENALAKARAAAGTAVPPDHVLTLGLITESVAPGLADLALPGAAGIAASARLAGWLEKLAEEAMEKSPVNTGWALRALDHALDLPIDSANRVALIRIRDGWLKSPCKGALKPFVLVAGGSGLRIDAAGVTLNGKLVPAADLTGVRHCFTGFSAGLPRYIGWCSAEEGLALDETWFAELGGLADVDEAVHTILAAIHGYMVPSLVVRSLAAVREGGTLSLGEVQLGVDGVTFAEGEACVPFAQLRVAYCAERASLSSAANPARTVDLDPLLNWNVVLLPHLIAALTPRLP